MEKSKNDYGYLKLVDSINVFKPEGGTETVFDIVPYYVTDKAHMDNKKYADDAVVGDPWWKRPVKVHKDVGPDGVSVVCPTTFGKPCPLCEYGSKRRKDGAEWDELKEIFPKDRTIYLIVPVDVSECDVTYTEGEVHVMDQSDYVFLDFLMEEIGRDLDNENFPDPYNGLSLQIYWRAKKIGKKGKFAEASKIDFVDRDQQYDDKFMDSLPSLDEMLKVHSYKELEALYFRMEGMDDEITDADDDLEDEKPVRKRKTASRSTSRTSRPSRKAADKEPEDDPEEENPTRRKRRTEPEPEEDPEEEKPTRRKRRTDPEPEEEPEEKKPTRRRRPVAKGPELEEEPEEDPEVEPEPEEEKPRRRKPAAKKTGKCPFGHEFGVDTDGFEDCDRCKVWDDCKDEKDA